MRKSLHWSTFEIMYLDLTLYGLMIDFSMPVRLAGKTNSFLVLKAIFIVCTYRLSNTEAFLALKHAFRQTMSVNAFPIGF